MSKYSGAFQPPLMTPPQYGGEIPAQPSSWPTVIGVLLIVVASIGLLSNTCNGIMSLVMPMIMGAVGEAAKDDPMIKVNTELAQRYMLFNVANAAILVILGVIMLIGAIGLLRRRRSSIGKIKLWAIGRIVWSIPAAYATYVIMNETTKAMEKASADSNQPMASGLMAIMKSLGPISAAFSLLLWCAVPVFILIWFMRSKIKNEVSTWS